MGKLNFGNFLCIVLSTILFVVDATDYFGCYKAGNCANPLESSARCINGKDYNIYAQTNGLVAVLSIHGGSIEKDTSVIADQLAAHYGWARYDFNGAPFKDLSSSCKALGSNGLHIASMNFDDPVVLRMVRSRPSIAIHRYNLEAGMMSNENKGMICVGGNDVVLRQAFIDSLSENFDEFLGYKLYGVDATKVSDRHACNLNSTTNTNAVNQNLNGEGLQLLFNDFMMVNMKSVFFPGALKKAIFGAASGALHKFTKPTPPPTNPIPTLSPTQSPLPSGITHAPTPPKQTAAPTTSPTAFTCSHLRRWAKFKCLFRLKAKQLKKKIIKIVHHGVHRATAPTTLPPTRSPLLSGITHSPTPPTPPKSCEELGGMARIKCIGSETATDIHSVADEAIKENVADVKDAIKDGVKVEDITDILNDGKKMLDSRRGFLEVDELNNFLFDYDKEIVLDKILELKTVSDEILHEIGPFIELDKDVFTDILTPDEWLSVLLYTKIGDPEDEADEKYQTSKCPDLSGIAKWKCRANERLKKVYGNAKNFGNAVTLKANNFGSSVTSKFKKAGNAKKAGNPLPVFLKGIQRTRLKKASKKVLEPVFLDLLAPEPPNAVVTFAKNTVQDAKDVVNAAGNAVVTVAKNTATVAVKGKSNITKALGGGSFVTVSKRNPDLINAAGNAVVTVAKNTVQDAKDVVNAAGNAVVTVAKNTVTVAVKGKSNITKALGGGSFVTVSKKSRLD